MTNDRDRPQSDQTNDRNAIPSKQHIYHRRAERKSDGYSGYCEKRAEVSFDGAVKLDLKSKVRNGKLYVDQGIIAGCAGGGFENICDAADILKGASIGPDEFTLSVYPASTPIYMELVKNGAVASLMETGAIVKTAFCGPCFGAGDTPANNAFSIRHSTRNFPNREVPRSRRDRLHPLRLWMQDPLQQLQQIRDI